MSPRRPAVSLTTRELEIANLIARGFTPKEIAGRLEISVRTVRDRIESAKLRLQVRTTPELAAAVARARGEESRTT